MQWIRGVLLIILGIKFPILGLIMFGIVAIYIFMLSKGLREIDEENDTKWTYMYRPKNGLSMFEGDMHYPLNIEIWILDVYNITYV